MKLQTLKQAAQLYQETADLIEQARQKARRLLALAGGEARLTSATSWLELNQHFDELGRLLGSFAEHQIHLRAKLRLASTRDAIKPLGGIREQPKGR